MGAMSSEVIWRCSVAARIPASAATFLAGVSAIYGPTTAGSPPALRLARYWLISASYPAIRARALRPGRVLLGLGAGRPARRAG